jgi:hypothetical protein
MTYGTSNSARFHHAAYRSPTFSHSRAAQRPLTPSQKDNNNNKKNSSEPHEGAQAHGVVTPANVTRQGNGFRSIPDSLARAPHSLQVAKGGRHCNQRRRRKNEGVEEEVRDTPRFLLFLLSPHSG